VIGGLSEDFTLNMVGNVTGLLKRTTATANTTRAFAYEQIVIPAQAGTQRSEVSTHSLSGAVEGKPNCCPCRKTRE
jgi:hypothetical protein